MESIYNLVPEPYVEPEKPPMYRSKYDPMMPLTSSTFGLHGTTATYGGGINEIRKVSFSEELRYLRPPFLFWCNSEP